MLFDLARMGEPDWIALYVAWILPSLTTKQGYLEIPLRNCRFSTRLQARAAIGLMYSRLTARYSLGQYGLSK